MGTRTCFYRLRKALHGFGRSTAEPIVVQHLGYCSLDALSRLPMQRGNSRYTKATIVVCGRVAD
jgi:hypothetical protein